MEIYDQRDAVHEVETDLPNVNEIKEKTEIQNFYTNKTILITGGSGFLGILLIEKLLRSCSHLKKIILLMREKRGKSAETRIKEILDDEVFDKMKQQNRNYKRQLEILPGCCEKSNLGVDNETIKKLQTEVNIIFHSAATVRFDEHIKTAYETNVRGTKTLLEISKGMKNLQAFVYVSTLYCQSHLSYIDEKFYPAALTEVEMRTVLKSLDDDILGILTPKLLNGRFNTYTMTKAVAEELVGQYRSKFPVAVFRPSIVTATVSEPLTCWTNNLYGATGVFVGSAIGFLRTLYCEPQCKAEIIPADRCINGLIAVPLHIQKIWYTPSAEGRLAKEPVYNFVANQDHVLSWSEIMRTMEKLARKRNLAIDIIIWSFHLSLEGNYLLWLIKYYVFHLLPAPFFILMEKLAKQKPRIWQGYVKLYRYTHLYSFFMIENWKIATTNAVKLYEDLSKEDKILFNCNTDIDWNYYFFYMTKGLARYITKFDWNDEKREKIAKIKINGLFYIDKALIWTIRMLMLTFIFKFVIRSIGNVFPI